MNNIFENLEVKCLNTEWKIKKYITSGNFGKIYNVELKTNNNENKKKIIKIEDAKNGTLFCEFHLFVRHLKTKHTGLPLLLDHGTFSFESIKYRSLIMPNYGRPIYEIKNFENFFDQIIEALSFIHGVGYTHNDIKPDNILFENDNYCLIDFGLTTKKKVGIVNDGSQLYMSRFNHMGQYLPIGDIESLIYTILSLIGFEFSWKNDRNNKTILKKKKEFIKNFKNISNNNNNILKIFNIIKYLNSCEDNKICHEKIKKIVKDI